MNANENFKWSFESRGEKTEQEEPLLSTNPVPRIHQYFKNK